MIFEQYHGNFRIVLDQGSTPVKSVNLLKEYLQIHTYTNFGIIDKNVDISQHNSKAFKKLQSADIIA